VRNELESTRRHDHPAVTGKPLRWLQSEAIIELLAALLLFRTTHQSWWLAALVLAPDVLMLGYVGGTKIGAAFYNLAHSQVVPILLCLAAVEWDHPLVLAAGLLWLAHIGMDRAMTFGLKYDTDFQHTHLGDQSDATRDRHLHQESLQAAQGLDLRR
jgi:hypothetical protein